MIGLGDTNEGTASRSTVPAMCDDGHVAKGEIFCEEGQFVAHTASCSENSCQATIDDLGIFGLTMYVFLSCDWLVAAAP